MPPPYRLANYPHVWVVLVCRQCRRRGRYRLARLAQLFGAETLMDDVLFQLSKDCRYQRPPGTKLTKYGMRCQAQIEGKIEPPPPPALPDL